MTKFWTKWKAFADNKLKLTRMKRLVFERVENIVGKGGNAGYQHFLHFPTLFTKSVESSVSLTLDCLLSVLLDLSKSKAFADDRIKMTKKLKIALGRAENIAGKGEKCWLPAFSPFPTMFSKGYVSQSH